MATVIKVTVEGMRHALHIALSEHFDMLKVEADKAIDQALQEGIVDVCIKKEAEAVIQREVREHINRAIRRALEDRGITGRIDNYVKESVERLVNESVAYMEKLRKEGRDVG